VLIPRYRRVKCPNCGGYPFKFVSLARQCWACDWIWDPGEVGREIIGYREERE
jgi:hypothetical protein